MICASRAISFISLLTLAVSLPPSKRTNWAPPITQPNGDDCWAPGSSHSLKWNVTSGPTQFDNPFASAFLVVGGTVNYVYELATDFELTSGEANITIPEDNNLKAGMYKIELYGADGNWSPEFYIGVHCALYDEG